MEIGMRELRNDTSRVIAAVESGQSVTLTVHGRPVADIVPHLRRTRWRNGEEVRRQLLAGAQADPGLTADLDELAGWTLDEL